ncbi:MAG TPA: DedA family protein [Solirubrobacterales bacterium]
MPVLALFSVPKHLGYLALALLVGVESTGVPVPGETALIAAGVLSHDGEMDIVVVIAVAAAAAVIGDNLGYLIGRHGGRRLLEAPGPLERHRLSIIAKGEPFFETHGPKAVFLGRWVAGLRIAAAWLAGITHMHWRTFFFWNLLGGIAWATSVGLAAYLLGPVAKKIIEDFGIAAIALVVLAALAYAAWWWRRRGAESSAIAARRGGDRGRGETGAAAGAGAADGAAAPKEAPATPEAPEPGEG